MDPPMAPVPDMMPMPMPMPMPKEEGCEPDPELVLAADPDPVVLERYEIPGLNSADEPRAAKVSMVQAGRFLDRAALHWQQTYDCFTCHTNFAYLMARPSLSAAVPAHGTVRAFAEEMIGKRWPTNGPRWDAEVVVAAVVLSMNDAATGGVLHDRTREAFSRMWGLQREDGGWEWLKAGYPPLEYDDHYGATLAAVGVGAAPGGYMKTQEAERGLSRVRAYLRANPPQNLHHKGMLLWAEARVGGILSEAERQAHIGEVFAAQNEDGGFCLATLGGWQRADGKPAETASDGYGTGFAVYVLRQAGVSARDGRIRRAVAWLKANQREGGRWFTRSPTKDGVHFITHAGTAFAVMALKASECLIR